MRNTMATPPFFLLSPAWGGGWVRGYDLQWSHTVGSFSPQVPSHRQA